MADHLYHWKHGWVPLDHHAALQKAKGNHAAALRMLGDAAHGGGIHNRADVANAIKGMHEVPPADRPRAIADVVHAAEHHGVADTIVPPTYKTRGTREQLRRDLADAQRAQQLRAEAATGGYKTETNGYFGGKGAASSSVTESKLTQASSDTEASRKAAADREEARAYRLEQQRRKAQGLVDEPPAEFHDAWAAQHNPFADHTPGHAAPAATPAAHTPGHAAPADSMAARQAESNAALRDLADSIGTDREAAARARFEKASADMFRAVEPTVSPRIPHASIGRGAAQKAAAQKAAEDKAANDARMAASAARINAQNTPDFSKSTVANLNHVIDSPSSSPAAKAAALAEFKRRGGVDTPATAETQRVQDKARALGDQSRVNLNSYNSWTPAELSTAINSPTIPQDQRNTMQRALRQKVDKAKADVTQATASSSTTTAPRVVTSPDGQTFSVPQGTRTYTHAGFVGPLAPEHGAGRHGEYVFAGFSQSEEGARRLASASAGQILKQSEYQHGKGKVKKAPVHVRPTAPSPK